MQRQNDTLFARFWKLIRFLIEPPPEITDVQQKRQARLLSALLLIIILLGSISGTVQILTVPGFLSTFVAIGIAIIALSLAYALTRTKNYLLAATIAALTPSIASYAALLTNPRDQSAFVFMLISVLLGSILLNQWFTLGIACLNLLALLLLPIFQPAWTISSVTGPISYQIIIPALIIIAMRHRDLVEHDRQMELRESELKFRSIFNNSVDAIGVSKSGIHIMVNPAYVRMFGCDNPDQFVGKSIFDLIAPAYRAQILDYVRRRAAGENIPKIYETRGLRCDGTEFDMEVHVSTYELGGALYTVPILRDISERKQVERSLQDSERRFREMLEGVGLAGVMLDGTGQVTFINDFLLQITGWLREDVLGKNWFDTFLPSDSREPVRSAYDELITGAEIVPHYENEIITNYGERRLIRWNNTILFDSNSHIIGTASIGEDITERKRIEEKLRLSGERYRTLAQNLPDSALLLFDQDLRFSIVDGQEIEATGFSREMLEGKTLREALPAEFAQVVEPNMRRTLAGESFSVELPYEDRFYRYSYVPLRNSSGMVTMAMILATNITHLKEVDAALKDSQRRLSTALRATKVGVWEWNIRTNKTYWSDENYKVMGLEPGSVESRYENWASTVHPDDLPAAEAKVTEAINNRSELNIEFRVVWPDGNIRWINDIGSLTFNETSEPIGMYGIQMDITERKRIQQELEKNQRRLAFLISGSPSIIYSAKTSGDFGTTFVSGNATKLLGYPPEMFTENPGFWVENVHPDDQPRVNREIDRLFETGSHSYEYRYRKADGQYVWMRDEMLLVRDESGNLLEVIGSWVDITQRKLAEEEREKLIRETEAKNAELERFTYTVSHDLKSPLVTINGFLGYLEQDALAGNTERLQRDIQRIHAAVKKMQILLNELLELSRIGRVLNPQEPAQFHDLVQEAMTLVRGQFNASGVVVRVQPYMPVVFVDKLRIIEVLQNLLDNCVKYMGAQPQPRIEIGQRGEEDGKPVFYIKDNGLGVAPEYHERIFGLFNKLDAKSEGTGVGLALVKRIIEVHDGRVWIESKLGQGSTFLFTLPSSTSASIQAET